LAPNTSRAKMSELSSKYHEQVIAGPILKTVFSLAAPVTLNMLMEFALSVTDFYWVGKLGPAAQDSITSSMVVVWTFFASTAIISIGMTALVSRYVGAGDYPQTVRVIRQGLSFSILLGLVIFVSGWLATPLLMRFMGTSEATFGNAVPYLRIFFIATPLFAVAETIYAIFRASGDTRTPTRVGVMVVVINMVLDPFLIFGIGPFPELGVKGASVASLVAIAIGLLLIVRELRRGKTGYEVPKAFGARPELKDFWRIARIGMPIATQQLIFVFVYWFLIRIVHQFGEDAGAAMGIGNRMESFSYLVCYGISLAASTMVGQNLGAGKPKRAARCAWTAAGAGVGVTLVMSVLFLSIPGLIASVFTADPEVHHIAVDYLIILGLSQFTMAIEIILEGAFSGSGDTLPPMIVSVPGSIARVPLAYFLAFGLGWGINGVWWTLTITTTVKALALALWFARGKWKQKQV